jgi:O-antigen/teichoic acid export membrane protein
MIENKLDLTSLAVYNVAISIASITDTLMYAIQSATYPTIYELLKKNMREYSNTISQMYRIIGLVVLGIISLLIAASPIGIINFLRTDYIIAIQLIPILLISYSFRFLYTVYAEPIFFFKQTHKLPWITLIGGVATIVGNLILLPIFGLAGAAFSFIFSKIIILVPTYYWYLKASRFRFKLGYFYPITLMILVFSFIIFYFFSMLIHYHWILYVICFIPLISLISYLYINFVINNNYRFSIASIKNILKDL